MRKQLPFVVAAAIAVALSMPTTYSVLRAYEVLFTPPGPNPATVVWSAHIAMFWRLWIALYVAGMIAPLAYFAATRDFARTIRVLGASVVVVAAVNGIQGVLLP